MLPKVSEYQPAKFRVSQVQSEKEELSSVEAIRPNWLVSAPTCRLTIPTYSFLTLSGR